MRRLDDIRVRLEGSTPPPAEPLIGNALPILYEIADALERLHSTGETAIIDLRALPLAPGDRERLQEVLGAGELNARLEALGPSEVRETGIHGVWWVTHHNAEEEIMAEFIEVTQLPDILRSDPQDVVEGLARLRERLAAAPEAMAEPVSAAHANNGGAEHV